jgi:RNA polymerase sigma-70 factor (ECF subfamily)
LRCLRLLGNPAEAEDATQETFLKVYRHLDVPTGDVESLRWIFRIATNHCLTVIRDRKPTEELRPSIPAGQALEEVLANRDLARRIVASMPEKLRLPAWLHHVDEMGLEEVAAMLDLSPRTISTRLEAFRERAQRLIAREVP